MSLMLVTIRCPDNVAPERREIHGGEFSIGRGRDSDWVVADPERHLSKRHCRLIYGDGDWELEDLSTNGTFVNQSTDPIGKGASQKIRHGDRIKFGLYEIEVILDDFMMYYQTLQAQMDEVRSHGKDRIETILDERQRAKFNKMLSELQTKRIR